MAGLDGFNVHDVRHTFINNRRLEGHDYFRIMAATGHKTMSVFKRYNTVNREELKALVGDENGHQYGHLPKIRHKKGAGLLSLTP